MKSHLLHPSLRELHRLFGDQGLKDLINAYLETLNEFDTYLNSPEDKTMTMSKMAHKLKATSWSMAENEMGNLCELLEATPSSKVLFDRAKLQIVQTRKRLQGQLTLLETP